MTVFDKLLYLLFGNHSWRDSVGFYDQEPPRPRRDLHSLLTRFAGLVLDDHAIDSHCHQSGFAPFRRQQAQFCDVRCPCFLCFDLDFQKRAGSVFPPVHWTKEDVPAEHENALVAS